MTPMQKPTMALVQLADQSRSQHRSTKQCQLSEQSHQNKDDCKCVIFVQQLVLQLTEWDNLFGWESL